MTNVKASNLLLPTCDVRVIFEDKFLTPIDNRITMSDFQLPSSAYHEFTYSIVYKKKKYRLRYMGFAPFSSDRLPQPPVQNSPPDVVYMPAPNQPTMPSNTGAGQSNTGVTINVGIGNTNTTIGQPNPSTLPSTPPVPIYDMPGYNGPVGCPWPMHPKDFENALASIKKNSFDDDKLMVAKQIISSNCFTSEQVVALAKVYTFDDERLITLKTCYDHTFDQGNYYKMFPLLTFSRSKQELDDYLNTRKR